MKIYGKEHTPRDLQELAGDLSQIAGIKRYTYSDGRAMNARAIEVKTGTGLYFNMIEDRCLDIFNFEYKGIPFGHIAKCGVTAPWYYDPHGAGWTRTFHGGLFTTCGFTQAGMDCKMDGKAYGLHGRASNTPAEEVNTFTKTTRDDIELIVTGKIREAAMEMENITLFRTISTKVGSNTVKLVDEYTNNGFCEEAVMLVYHCNLGYPIFSEDSKLIADVVKTTPFTKRFPDSINALNECFTFTKPSPNAQTQVFFHELAGEDDASVTLVNTQLKLGIKISFKKSQLPCFGEARVLKSTDYYCVLEPGNCYPLGRLEQSKQYGLEMLAPNQTKRVEIEFEVIETDW